MLAFEVEYLLGRVFAGGFQDRAQSEWPPHPARLFSALVSACFETGASPEARLALEWLESLGPPQIRAAEPGDPTPTTAFVPTNYPGAGLPLTRVKQPRQFPSQAPAEATVFFIWPEAQPSPSLRDSLDDLACRTGYLGKACSLVRMRVADYAPEPNYVPDETGDESVRVASAGRVGELQWLFGAGQRPSFGLQQRYTKCSGQTRHSVPETVFGDMLIFERTGGAGLPVEATLTLTTAVRKALMGTGGQQGPLPEALHGHAEEPHCAIAALPFAGALHADGHLLGFAVVMPRKIRSEDRRAILSTCSNMNTIHLPPPMMGWNVEPLIEPSDRLFLRDSTWSRPATRWSTVTPILLDRFPKKKGPTVEDIIRSACVRIGLPEKVGIEHGPYSRLPGVPPVPLFRLRRKPGEPARWGVHATLTFDQPVRGPVLLGAGRFFGMGLLKPDARPGHGDRV